MAAVKAFGDTYLPKQKPKGVRARVAALDYALEAMPPHYRACLALLVSWRNRHVHRSTDAISSSDREELVSAQDAIYEAHSHCDILKTLEQYDGMKGPTLKDISTLISASHRAIAAVDAKILVTANLKRYAQDVLSRAFRKSRKTTRDAQ
ncbi:hypothetical protein [Mesorhizobium sp.]|uniref:hypothetical protein n=1 Tax=Mesorhizobium sp. TaxID=1871066 RepID=UPI000FE98F4B|nr:hypothetical protein [Mesorhizobium sp.]RWO89815.1 MAG: hypothetical protein EOQ95_16835 [Mesorhizobium sp.]